MYRVWVWHYGVLQMFPCGSNMVVTLRLLKAYFKPPMMLSWLEYIKEKERRQRKE